MNYEWWLKELKEVLIPAAQGEHRINAEKRREWCWAMLELQREGGVGRVRWRRQDIPTNRRHIMAETTIHFKALGRNASYSVNDLGSSERLEFDGVVISESFGEVGPYRGHEWGRSQLLYGAAKRGAEYRVLHEHAEWLLSEALIRAHSFVSECP